MNVTVSQEHLKIIKDMHKIRIDDTNLADDCIISLIEICNKYAGKRLGKKALTTILNIVNNYFNKRESSREQLSELLNKFKEVK